MSRGLQTSLYMLDQSDRTGDNKNSPVEGLLVVEAVGDGALQVGRHREDEEAVGPGCSTDQRRGAHKVANLHQV